MNLKKIIMAFALLSISVGASAATVSMDWTTTSGPLSFTDNLGDPATLSLGVNVSTTSSTLFNTADPFTPTLVATGTISDFTLAVGELISGTFTEGLVTYSISGIIDTIDFFGGGSFAFSGISATGNILSGSISVTPGSSSMDLYGQTIEVSAVPVPAAVWLFGSALVGLFGAKRRSALASA